MSTTDGRSFTAAQVEAARLTVTLDELDRLPSPGWLSAVAQDDPGAYRVAARAVTAKPVLAVDPSLRSRDEFGSDDAYVAYLLTEQHVPEEQRPAAERAIRSYLRTVAA